MNDFIIADQITVHGETEQERALYVIGMQCGYDLALAKLAAMASEESAPRHSDVYRHAFMAAHDALRARAPLTAIRTHHWVEDR